MINEILLDGEILKHKPIKLRGGEIKDKKKEIKCHDCKKLCGLKNLRKEFFEKAYYCLVCSRSGERNPFYGKTHTQETKFKIGSHNKEYYQTHPNPFLGKHHSEENKQKHSKKMKGMWSGNKNPFYNKKHKKESIEKIIKSSKEWREKNKKEILIKQLNCLGKNINDFKIMLNDYITNLPNNLNFIQEKYNLDKRTIIKYWIELDLIEKDELKKITTNRKLNTNPSKPEYDLYTLLKTKYNEINVIKNYNISKYYYDICLFNKILIEYDGFYWHEIIGCKNDSIKNHIAKENGFFLCRIKEIHRNMKNVKFDKIQVELFQYIKKILNNQTTEYYKEIKLKDNLIIT